MPLPFVVTFAHLPNPNPTGIIAIYERKHADTMEFTMQNAVLALPYALGDLTLHHRIPNDKRNKKY